MGVNLLSLRGKHFKVYDPDGNMVLAHPRDTEEVNVLFNAVSKDGNPFLEICVTDFIEEKMRIPGQHPRADLYILAENAKKIVESLKKPIKDPLFNVEKKSFTNVSFGFPKARNGRQSVPTVECLYQYNFHSIIVPFSSGLLIFKDGKGSLDIERPGADQSKWKAEGSSTQLHLSFFHPRQKEVRAFNSDLTFYAYIPWIHVHKIRDACENLYEK